MGMSFEPGRLSVSEARALRAVCRDSFFEFVKEFWSVVVPNKPDWNWHIPYLCQEYEVIVKRILEGKHKLYDLVNNQPPGTTKSTLASVMLPAWALAMDPSFRFIGGSFSFPLQQDLSRKTRDIMESEKYRECFPDTELRGDQNTKQYFMTTKGGFRFAVGAMGAVMGFHAHLIVTDDPLDPEESYSPADLHRVNRWVRETLSSRKVDKDVSCMILVMQRLNMDDPTAQFLLRKNIRWICLPAESCDNVQPPGLRAFYRQGLLDPGRLSRKYLREAEQQYGQYGFAAQFRQSPVPPGGGMFQVAKMPVITGLGAGDQFVARCRFWDKAGTSKGGAYTVGVLMGVTRRGLYVVEDVVRVQVNSHAREQLIRKTAETDGRKVIVGIEQEPGSGGKESAELSVRSLAGFKVRVSKVETGKVDRADTMSVQVNGGNLAMFLADWNRDFTDELKFFPFSRYKDQVDAASGAFSILARPRGRAGVIH